MESFNDVDGALACARTLLFVPGNRPERFAKAMASGTDAVAFDLEDSVPAVAKSVARETIGAAWTELRSGALPIVVRINAPDCAAGAQDLEWLGRATAGTPPPAVMVPKAHSQAALAQVANTAMQCSPDENELAPLRFAVSMATRQQRLAPAIDGVTVDIVDEARLRDDTRRTLRFGFGGKLCVHPRQVSVVHAAMAPSAEETAWARRVIAANAASGGAAVQLDGRMIDAPVVLSARRVLAWLRSGDRA